LIEKYGGKKVSYRIEPVPRFRIVRAEMTDDAGASAKVAGPESWVKVKNKTAPGYLRFRDGLEG